MTNLGEASKMELMPAAGRVPDQVAYVFEELEPAVEKIGRRLGITRWLGWRYTADYLPKREYRGQPGNFESWGVVPEFSPAFEIIAPLSGESVFTEFLSSHGPGLHHLGYFVPSLDNERTRLNALGLEQVQYGGGHGVDGDGQIGYFELTEELTDDHASYVEIIEPPKHRHPFHFEYIVGEGLREAQ